MESVQKTVYKGIVVDKLKDENKVIVLMRNGELRKVRPHRPYEIGEEILFKEEVVLKRVTNWNRIFSTASAIAVACSLFFMDIPFISDSGNQSIGVKDVYASSIYIESNADVKIDVNKDHKVIKVTPLNKSAKDVLDDLHWTGEQIDEFINDYFNEMKDEGYLDTHDKAVISVLSGDKSEVNNTLKEVKKALHKNHFLKMDRIKVLTVTLPKKVIEKAENLKLTPAKLSIACIVKSMEKNVPPIPVLKKVTVTDLINKNPIVADVLPKYSEEELAKLVEQVDLLASPETSQPEMTTGSTIETTTETKNTDQSCNQSSTSSESTQTTSETKADSSSTESKTENNTDSTTEQKTTSSGTSQYNITSSEARSEQTPMLQTENMDQKPSIDIKMDTPIIIDTPNKDAGSSDE